MKSRLAVAIAVSIVAAGSYAGLAAFEAHLQRQVAALQPSYTVKNAPNTPQNDQELPPGFVPSNGRDGVEVGIDTGESGDTLRQWQRESWFIDVNNYLRKGIGPGTIGEFALEQARVENPNAIRILAVGDSFLAGMGTADLDTIWARQLERRLNDTYGYGTFKVDILARSGASLMEEVEWLTPARLEQLQPDLILMGYVINDPLPSWRETSICATGENWCGHAVAENSPELRACLAGNYDIVATTIRTGLDNLFPAVKDWALKRYCDPERFAVDLGMLTEASIANDPLSSPFWPDYEKALEQLGELSDKTPLAIVQTAEDSFKSVEPAFARHNLRTIPWTQNQYKALEGLPPSALLANPVDGHHGPGKAKVVADMVAGHISNLIDPDRLREAQQEAQPVAQHMVSSVLPAWISVKNAHDTATISNPLNRSVPQRVSEIYAAVDGPPQYAGCLPIGRPHARVMLDPYRAGHNVTITQNEGEELLVFSAGYQSNGTPIYQQEGTVRPGTPLRLSQDSQRYGILLASSPETCGLQKAPALSAFTVTLQYN